MEQGQQGSVWIIVLIGVVFVGIAAMVTIQKIKRKGAQWTGVVIDKNMNESVKQHGSRDRDTIGGNGFSIGIGGNNAVRRSYNLRIRDDGGKEFNWPVGEGVYQSVNVGDRLQKQPGTETPTILSQAVGGGVAGQPIVQIGNSQEPQAAKLVQPVASAPVASSQDGQQPPVDPANLQ